MLKKSVGAKSKNAKNERTDVRTVQKLLNLRLDLLAPLRKLVEDGRMGSATQTAINHVQSKIIGNPDGRIDPYGTTIKKLWPVKYANPTGKKIRGSDAFGAGHHGASRGSRLHDGADFESTAGQQVIAPLSGRVTKISRPYASGTDAGLLSGVEIVASDGTHCWVWYMTPKPGIVDTIVEAGKSKIGTAATLQNRYPRRPTPLINAGSITDHLHVRIHTRHGAKVNPAKVIKVRT